MPAEITWFVNWVYLWFNHRTSNWIEFQIFCFKESIKIKVITDLWLTAHFLQHCNICWPLLPKPDVENPSPGAVVEPKPIEEDCGAFPFNSASCEQRRNMSIKTCFLTWTLCLFFSVLPKPDVWKDSWSLALGFCFSTDWAADLHHSAKRHRTGSVMTVSQQKTGQKNTKLLVYRPTISKKRRPYIALQISWCFGGVVFQPELLWRQISEACRHNDQSKATELRLYKIQGWKIHL